MTKEHKYDGDTFLLEYSDEGYIRVTYKDQIGVLGIAQNGTLDSPYRWSVGIDSTPSGLLRSGTSSGNELERNLNGLCKDLIQSHRRSEELKAFRPEDAREKIKEYYEKLP